MVNRVWANYFGRGLVHPFDDLRYSNPASNEPLLETLSADFVAGGYDLRALMRTIMLSAAYQRSAEARPGNEKDDRFYSRYLTRRLPAEVILDAFSQVTGVPEDFGGYPRGTRAMQLRDTRVDSYFLSVFGRPERVLTSSAERMQDPTLPQALHTINGETLNNKLMADDGLIARMVADGRSNEDVLTELYWSALSRPPSARERSGSSRASAKTQPARPRRPPPKSRGPGVGRAHVDRVPFRALIGDRASRCHPAARCPSAWSPRFGAACPRSAAPRAGDRPTSRATSCRFSRATACAVTTRRRWKAACCSKATKT